LSRDGKLFPGIPRLYFSCVIGDTVINLQKKPLMADSFILGLSSGSACLLTCGMVMFPYLMAGSSGVKRIAVDVSVFLITRLVIYFILATLAWY